ncbi:alpha/beta-hydrolase [Thozetella sp. PMI_491]|nr:alpha/beta-hydrolase [Thozetella sp. PMI_491]
MFTTTAEDCLKLAVWAPIHVKENAKLPVILFIPGGAFEIGGLNVPYQLPAGWVERTQQHIAIVANYRLDIMGFPNAAGLEDQNPGLLDQRRALEWVYDNIAAFGGDRDRITLWGQSAGAISVDMQLFAFPEEPLITGAFVQSGTAIGSTKPPDHEHRNFTFVAKKLGCDFPRDAAAELECMQTLPVVHILNFIGNYSDHAMQPPLSFRPTPDERTVWLNYTKRAAEGHMARVPAIVSTTTNEAAFFGYPSDLSVGPNQEVVHQATVASFLCPAVSLMNARAGLGLRTYRYQYGGNFSNVAPLPWLGAYHASDIPMFMGSYELNGPATKFETRVAHAMQDFLYAFMVDTRNGLKHKGWPPHDGTVKQGGRIMRFGIDGEVDLVVDGRKVDKECVSRAQYNLEEGGAVPPRQQGAQIPVTFTGEL